MEKKILEADSNLATKVKRVAVGFVILILAATVDSLNTRAADNGKKPPRVVYPTRTKLDFEGTQIEGELKNPGEFYFQHRPEDKMDSLVKRRTNFHREMLRDVVLSK